MHDKVNIQDKISASLYSNTEVVMKYEEHYLIKRTWMCIRKVNDRRLSTSVSSWNDKKVNKQVIVIMNAQGKIKVFLQQEPYTQKLDTRVLA